MKPTIGRIVHFVQKTHVYGQDKIVHLPAIIVAVWSDTCVNLQVFTDGSSSESDTAPNGNPQSIKWITSASYSEAEDANYTWHWPEREGKPDGKTESIGA